jgi:DNA-binding NarL/FixJ family response regulator
MKNLTTHAHNDIQTIAGDADGETAVSGLPENPKPENGNSTARKQIGELTSREIEVLQFIAQGKLNKQTASELCISIKTVEKHRYHLSNKLGIHGTAGLTHFAIFTGVIECNPQFAMA